jgi:hypothetical protein
MEDPFIAKEYSEIILRNDAENRMNRCRARVIVVKTMNWKGSKSDDT